MLEARPRLGGRIDTRLPAGWPAPVEAGTEFVHGRPARSSPRLTLARRGTRRRRSRARTAARCRAGGWTGERKKRFASGANAGPESRYDHSRHSTSAHRQVRNAAGPDPHLAAVADDDQLVAEPGDVAVARARLGAGAGDERQAARSSAGAASTPGSGGKARTRDRRARSARAGCARRQARRAPARAPRRPPSTRWRSWRAHGWAWPALPLRGGAVVMHLRPDRRRRELDLPAAADAVEQVQVAHVQRAQHQQQRAQLHAERLDPFGGVSRPRCRPSASRTRSRGSAGRTRRRAAG